MKIELAIHICWVYFTNSTNHKLKTIFLICSWESQECLLCALYYTILYKGIENLWISVSAVSWNQSPPHPPSPDWGPLLNLIGASRKSWIVLNGFKNFHFNLYLTFELFLCTHTAFDQKRSLHKMHLH